MRPGEPCEVIGAVLGPSETAVAEALSARRGPVRLVRRCGDLVIAQQVVQFARTHQRPQRGQ